MTNEIRIPFRIDVQDITDDSRIIESAVIGLNALAKIAEASGLNYFDMTKVLQVMVRHNDKIQLELKIHNIAGTA